MSEVSEPCVKPRASRLAGVALSDLGGGKPSARDWLALPEYLAQPVPTQKQLVETEWASLAYTLAKKALRLAVSGTKKEAGAIQQLVTSAAIAKDKRFPSEESGLSLKLPASLLGSVKLALEIRTPQPVVKPDNSAAQ